MVLGPQSKIVALVGGVGGAKLAYGLVQILPPERLTIIGNVADDFELYGLHISPDLDTVMYTLAGVANPTTGWGIDGDTWQMVDMLARFGEDIWFRLGDRDLATHLLRTQWLKQGLSLTAVTARLSKALGTEHRLLPVTDGPLATMVDTEEHGTLGFQEYFVEHRWQPTAKRVWYRNVEHVRATDAVVSALSQADVIMLGPSNPVLSIAPILAVPGVRSAIRACRGVCVALSPFVDGKAVKGPADKLMRELGLDFSPAGLVMYYAGLLDGLVIDRLDADQELAEGIPVLSTDTLMKSNEDKVRVANEMLDWVGSVLE
jgi:LPPG:FO 2-phospho-L-lactate transferase